VKDIGAAYAGVDSIYYRIAHDDSVEIMNIIGGI